LEDRLNPKQNGDAQPQAASSYTRIQGETSFKGISWSACMLRSFSCPLQHKKVVDKIGHRGIASYLLLYCWIQLHSLLLNNSQVI